jgi:hypothetical protein
VNRHPLQCELIFPSGDSFEHSLEDTHYGIFLPSCRFFPSRVLALLDYDAYWLRQALDVYTS